VDRLGGEYAGAKMMRTAPRATSLIGAALSVALTLALAAAGAEPDQDAPRLYKTPSFSVELAGVEVMNVVSAKTGAHSLVTVKRDKTSASLCVVPVTSYNVVQDAYAKGHYKTVTHSLKMLMPCLRKLEVSLKPLPGETGATRPLVLTKAVEVKRWPVLAYVWQAPEAESLVYLLVRAPQEEAASAFAKRIRLSFKAKAENRYPLRSPSSGLDVPVPNDWTVLRDAKKRYWAAPDGKVFIMASYPFPVLPLVKAKPGHGVGGKSASTAIKVAETLSGRKAQVQSVGWVFDRRLWVQMSRADGTVQYKSGKFKVRMDRWFDLRTGGIHRVYYGGLTDKDFQRAKAIRDGIAYLGTRIAVERIELEVPFGWVRVKSRTGCAAVLRAPKPHRFGTKRRYDVLTVRIMPVGKASLDDILDATLKVLNQSLQKQKAAIETALGDKAPDLAFLGKVTKGQLTVDGIKGYELRVPSAFAFGGTLLRLQNRTWTFKIDDKLYSIAGGYEVQRKKEMKPVSDRFFKSIRVVKHKQPEG
jgi:hypothetical protein